MDKQYLADEGMQGRLCGHRVWASRAANDATLIPIRHLYCTMRTLMSKATHVDASKLNGERTMTEVIW